VAETDKVARGQPVFFKKLDDGLKVPTAGKVNRVLIPAFEGFFLVQINPIVDVLVEVDMVYMVLEIMLLRMHTAIL
jgi:hypothetical protein